MTEEPVSMLTVIANRLKLLGSFSFGLAIGWLFGHLDWWLVYTTMVLIIAAVILYHIHCGQRYLK